MTCAQLCPTLRDLRDDSPSDFSVHEKFPSKNTGMSCHCLLQGIFLTRGLNTGLLHWQADSVPLAPLGSLEKGMSTHSSILAKRTPWTEEPGRLQSKGHKELDMTMQL